VALLGPWAPQPPQPTHLVNSPLAVSGVSMMDICFCEAWPNDRCRRPSFVPCRNIGTLVIGNDVEGCVGTRPRRLGTTHRHVRDPTTYSALKDAGAATPNDEGSLTVFCIDGQLHLELPLTCRDISAFTAAAGRHALLLLCTEDGTYLNLFPGGSVRCKAPPVKIRTPASWNRRRNLRLGVDSSRPGSNSTVMVQCCPGRRAG
jgi:hypothetical protein